MSNLQYFVLICDKKKKSTFVKLMDLHGVKGIDISYGRGSATADAFAQALGFEIEEHKVVISGLISTPRATELIKKLMTQHKFDRQNTGLAFTVPVEGLSV